MNGITLNPKFSFSKVSHRYPKKEEYVISKKISNIKNTPVSPSFFKKIIHSVSSFFHKIDMALFIKNIKNINNNQKLDSYEKLKVDNIIYENNGDIDRRNKLISIVGENDEKNLVLNELLNKYREEINNSMMLNDLIYNSDAKFDFYSFTHYLTEVKKAKDYFLLTNHLDNFASNEHDLSTIFSIIINKRLNALNINDFENIYKLVNNIYNFEKIHLNNKYNFISNFSSVKKRDEFISCINLLVIAEDELDILNRFDSVISEKIKYNLSTIMKATLGNKDNKNASFDELSVEWANIYINGYDFKKYENLDEELKDTFLGGELFHEEENKEKCLLVNTDNTEDKEIMDNVRSLLSRETTEISDTLLSSLKNNLNEVHDYLSSKESKALKEIELDDDLYYKLTHHENEIKIKLNVFFEKLNQIDLEEKHILNSLNLKSDSFYNIESYKNETIQLFKKINKILENENTSNLESIKNTLNDNFDNLESNLNNGLKDIQIFNIEGKKSVINGLINDLDKIILNSKNESLDNEINRLDDIVKQKSKDANMVNPLSFNHEVTPLVEIPHMHFGSNLYENDVNKLNLDELFTSLENNINEINSNMDDVINKFEGLSHNTKSEITTNSALSKVQELKNKYIDKQKIIITPTYNNLDKNNLDDKYIESAKKSKKLQEEINILKGKLEESKERYNKENQQANEDYINDLNAINKKTKRREDIKISKLIPNANISNNDDEKSKEITKNKPILSKDNKKSLKSNNITNGGDVIDDIFEGELRTEHFIDINSVSNIEIRDENVILIKDYKNKNKNIENVSFNVNENRVTYLRVDYDNKKVARNLKYVVGDETIKGKMKEINEIKNELSKLKTAGILEVKINNRKNNENKKEIDKKNRMLDSKINELKEDIKGDIKNIIDKINGLSKK